MWMNLFISISYNCAYNSLHAYCLLSYPLLDMYAAICVDGHLLPIVLYLTHTHTQRCIYINFSYAHWLLSYVSVCMHTFCAHCSFSLFPGTHIYECPLPFAFHSIYIHVYHEFAMLIAFVCLKNIFS